MFGNTTGRPESNQGNTQFVLDKIEELDRRITEQLACKHKNIEARRRTFQDAFHERVAVEYLTQYEAVCLDCGLSLEHFGPDKKAQYDYEQAKAKVEEYEGQKKSKPKGTLKSRICELHLHYSKVAATDSNSVRMEVLNELLDELKSAVNGEE